MGAPRPLPDHERALMFLAAVERPQMVGSRNEKIACLMGITGWPRYRTEAAIEEAVNAGLIEEIDS